MGMAGQYATAGIPRLEALQGVRCAQGRVRFSLEADVDLSKFKTSDWLKVGGAVVVLIAYFLDWTSIDCGGLPDSVCGNLNLSGSDFFFRGTLPWLLILAVGILTFLIASGTMKSGKLPWPLLFLAASGLATLLVLIYVIHPTYSGVSGIGRGIGSILALIGAAVVLYGSIAGFKESGGDFNDLKDMNKLKGAFQGSGGGSGSESAPPPPPPPPGMAPPPPPPPPA
jgi:hypothetical protein